MHKFKARNYKENSKKRQINHQNTQKTDEARNLPKL